MAKTNKAATPRRPYRVRRRIDITDAGLFLPGSVAMLTEAQYRADRNSLEPIAPPAAQSGEGEKTDDGAGGDGGDSDKGAPDENRDRMGDDLVTR